MSGIASVGPGLPQDLLLATGRYSGSLGWDVDRPTDDADRWLESKYPLWARSILQQWAEGRFDSHELVLFSRADDAAQRLYYYICELQRTGAVGGPEAMVLDIAKIPRATSLAHTTDAVRSLADRLGVSDSALEQAIVATNLRRGADTEATGAPTCLLAGTPPPDRRIHHAIEQAGFNAVGPTLADSWQDLGPRVDEGTGDPVAAIARQSQMRPDDQRGFDDHAAATVDRAKAIGATAAILWYTEEDESRVWNAPATQQALRDNDIPVLMLARRDWAARDGALESIRTFLQERGQ